MAVRLKVEDRSKKIVLAKDLEDGQMGVVIEDHYDYSGRILQRHENEIVSIGMHSDNGFTSECTLEIRILEKGELIEVL